MRNFDFLAPSHPNSGQDNASLIASGSDGRQHVIQLQTPLDRGWYRIRVEIVSDTAAEPKLYFDTGHGFSEVFSARMKHIKGRQFSIVTRLPGNVTAIKLDPMNQADEYRLLNFSAGRLAGVGLAKYLAQFGFAVFRADPRGFASRLPRYVNALTRPRFLTLGDPQTYRRMGGSSYESWIARHDFDERHHTGPLRQAVAAMTLPPLISVVMPTYNTPAVLLREAIDSVISQIYPNWQLCIADDASTAPHVREILAEYAEADSRIKIVLRPENGHISAATNSAFAIAEGEWIALLDHDDILRPHALAEVALEIERNPDAELIYSDEDKMDVRGRRYDPYFKPDFSRELFRSQNYLNHLTVHRAANIRAVGGWRKGFEGSQDYDLNLRILERIDQRNIRHIPKVLYHWRAVEGSTAASGGEKNYAYDAGLRALGEHVQRMRLPAIAEPAPDTPFYRMRFSVPQPAPLVSLIIPTRDKVELLQGCIESIRSKTTYSPYEIIVVDNGSVEPATLAYFETIAKFDNVRILSWDKPFNYSAINNFAVTQARGTIVGLINNDIVVISPDWLGEMVSWAAQEDVGCVGAKLYYPDDTIQHAGVLLGIGGVAGHSHKHFPRSHPGYFSRLKVLQNLSAVTAACLLVRKDVFEAVGGLDEENLKVAFNDVDLCLKIREAGYCNVWTPYAELYHLESVSRGTEDSAEKTARFMGEVHFMQTRWAKSLETDPAYSVNLTLAREDFSIRE